MKISASDIDRGHEAYAAYDPRDVMYRVARKLVDLSWGNPAEMTDGLGVLLLTWNTQFYRYGKLDFDRLELALRGNIQKLTGFRSRDLSTLSADDEAAIQSLFNDLTEALSIQRKSGKIIRSPVGTAKALHVLAPKFFPIWDEKIAKAYGCCYTIEPARKYIEYMYLNKDIANNLVGKVDIPQGLTLLKMIDEYNYMKFTKNKV